MGFDMAYRGDDLDLRTLQGFAPQGRELQELFQPQATGAGLRTRPLYVDDTVLACLNDAFDLAAVHRASDVRLEHLLNAMTRVEAAAKIMDLNGVRVAALRRDTGALIASELVGYANGKIAPRTGSDVEEVLRGAADRAASRRQAVAIEDLLDVLAEPGRDFTGVQVLRRNWGGRPLREAAAQVLPSFSLPYAVDPPRERFRVQARPAAYEPVRPDVQQAMTDQVQNNRIDGLERLVRQLSDELNAERKGMSAVFAEMQRELVAARDDSARYRGGLSDRLKSLELAVVQSGGQSAPQVVDRMAAIERGLDARFDDLARGWAALGERLQAVEFGVQKVRAQDPVVATVDMKPVERQLGELARSLAALGDRLAMLERTGNRTPASNEPVLDRISQLERAVNNGLGEGARNWLAMGERLKAMEKAVAARPAEVAPLAPLLDRIDALQRTIAQRPAQPPLSFAPVLERIEAMERSLAQRTVAAPVSLAPVMERIEALERSIRERVAQPATAVSLSPVLERFVQLERALEARSVDAARSVGQLAERIGRVEEGLATQNTGLAEAATRISSEIRAVTAEFGTAEVGVVDRVQTLLGTFGRERTELVAQVTQPVSEVTSRLERSTQSIEGLRHAISQIATRITTLEGQISGMNERLQQSGSTRDSDLIELHDALVKIGGNQQTLATALDQWRLDTAGDLNVISTRVEQMEKVADKPAQMMQQLAAEVQSMHAMQLKREARKSRFRMWLFGTEDWFGDSWERRNEEKAQSLAQSAQGAKAGTVPYLRR